MVAARVMVSHNVAPEDAVASFRCLLDTAPANTIALMPARLVVDVDRSTSTLYLHVLDIPDPDKADRFREQVRRIEAGLIRAIGSKEEVAMVKSEAANRRNGGTS